jgi:hypothetical protein
MMEHLFSGMEPPKRSKEDKQKSLQVIQQGLSMKKKKFNWPYYSVLTAAVALLFILIASLQTGTPSNVHSSIVTAPAIKNVYMFEQTDLDDEPRTFMSKWYNLDKLTFSKEEIDSLLPAIDRSKNVGYPIKTDQNYTALIVQYDDGVEHFYAIDVKHKQLINVTTNAVAQLEQSELVNLLALEEELQDPFPFILKIIVILSAYAAYFFLILKISPIRKIKLDKKSNWKQTFSGIGSSILITLLIGFTNYYYGADNLLFFASFYGLFFSIQLFVRRFIKGQPYSYWEIPFSTIAFTFVTVIFTL